MLSNTTALLEKMETFTISMKIEIGQIIVAMVEIVGKAMFGLVLNQSQSAFWPDQLTLSVTIQSGYSKAMQYW